MDLNDSCHDFKTRQTLFSPETLENVSEEVDIHKTTYSYHKAQRIDTSISPSGSYCCACLNTCSNIEVPANVSKSIVEAFSLLIGPVEIDVQFCSVCSNLLIAFHKFWQQSKASMEFLTKLHRAENQILKKELDGSENLGYIENDAKERAQSVKEHSEKGEKGPPLRYCDVCKEHFPFHLIRHILECHVRQNENGSVTCSLCEKVIEGGKLPIARHFTTHNTLEKPAVCKICGQSFFQKTALRNHMESHLLFECHHCGKKISTKSRLQRHIATQHMSAFLCSFCRKLFNDRREYIQHRFQCKATKSKPVIRPICDICGRDFISKFALSSHKASRHSHNQLPCEICGKVFCSKQSLQAHIRRFHAQVTLACDICGKKFAHERGMKTHMMHVHSSSKIVPEESHFSGAGSQTCRICGKVVQSTITLKRHIERVHSAQYSFTCKLCQRPFKLLSTLQKHYYSHRKMRPYNCHLCEKGYYMVDYLKTHYSREHGTEYSTAEVNDICIRVKLDPKEIQMEVQEEVAAGFEKNFLTDELDSSTCT